MTTLNGFDALSKIQQNTRSNTFTKLNALKRITIPATAPDNRVNVRFLYDGFQMVKVHGWVKVGDKNQTILCQKNDNANADCIICDNTEGYPSNRGIALVALVDNKENPIYEDISDAEAEDYADYAKVMDEKNITKKGDRLILNKIPQVRILDMGLGFWQDMSSFREKYETLCDRSYTIFRTGTKLDTKYSVAPSDKDTEYKNPELLQMSFEPGLDFCISIDDYVKFLGRQSLYDNFKKNLAGYEGEEESSEGAPSGNSEPNLNDMLG